MVLADKKRMWEFQALQSFIKTPCHFLPTSSYTRTRACHNLETMKAKLPWTTIAVIFEMLSGRLLGLQPSLWHFWSISKATQVSSMASHTRAWTTPAELIVWALALQRCWTWLQTAPTKVSTFPQPPRSRFPSTWVELNHIYPETSLVKGF